MISYSPGTLYITCIDD